jgi:glycosyltransferase involved in cell wall biosynthesis
LVERGHDVHVFTTNIDGPESSPVPIGTPVNLDGVQVRYFSCPLLRRLYWAPALGRALEREIVTFQAVHLHSVFLWPTRAAACAAIRAKVPYLIAPRGMLIKDLIARRSRIAKTVWIQLMERSNVERASAIHVTSQLEAAELERFGWRLPRTAVIPNGIDEPSACAGEISADVAAITVHQPLILFLGRLSWKKGLDRLLDAFAFARTGRLAIVGPDDEGLAPQLLSQAERLGVADRVVILPRTVVGHEKERLFAAARLFVLPSYSENFGNAVLEAMRRAVPVVVTAEVGAAEVVQQCGGGLVVQGDPQSLGVAMCRLISDDGFSRSLGEAGKRHAAAQYAWSSIAARMQGLYEDLSCGPRSFAARH